VKNGTKKSDGLNPLPGEANLNRTFLVRILYYQNNSFDEFRECGYAHARHEETTP